jgi:hypothetical protein
MNSRQRRMTVTNVDISLRVFIANIAWAPPALTVNGLNIYEA